VGELRGKRAGRMLLRMLLRGIFGVPVQQGWPVAYPVRGTPCSWHTLFSVAHRALNGACA